MAKAGCKQLTEARVASAVEERWSNFSAFIADTGVATGGITESKVFRRVNVERRRSPFRILTMEDAFDDEVNDAGAEGMEPVVRLDAVVGDSCC